MRVRFHSIQTWQFGDMGVASWPKLRSPLAQALVPKRAELKYRSLAWLEKAYMPPASPGKVSTRDLSEACWNHAGHSCRISVPSLKQLKPGFAASHPVWMHPCIHPGAASQRRRKSFGWESVDRKFDLSDQASLARLADSLDKWSFVPVRFIGGLPGG